MAALAALSGVAICAAGVPRAALAAHPVYPGYPEPPSGDASVDLADFATLAIPATVDRLAFDASRQRLSFETTARVQIRRWQMGSIIVLEVLDAHLRHPVSLVGPAGGGIRWIRARDIADVPALVRIEIALRQGVEPAVRIQQSAGLVFVSFARVPVPDGEQASEELPVVPSGPLPELQDLRQRPDHPVPRSWNWPSPPPVPTPSPAPPIVVPAQPEPPESLAPAPVASPTPAWLAPASDRRSRSGTMSYLLFDLAQSDAIEAVSPHTEIGYPLGLAGLEWKQWLSPNFGLGLDARYLGWIAHGTITQQRKQALGNLALAFRMPLPFVEPELSAGVGARYEAFGSTTGSGVAPMIGGGVRIQPLHALGLRLWGRDYPIGLGGDGFWSAGAEILIDAGWALASVGYTWDQITVYPQKNASGGHSTFGTTVVGLGFQY